VTGLKRSSIYCLGRKSQTNSGKQLHDERLKHDSFVQVRANLRQFELNTLVHISALYAVRFKAQSTLPRFMATYCGVYAVDVVGSPNAVI
jgi:hypothetical protein